MFTKAAAVPNWLQVTLGADPAAEHGFVWDCELGQLGPLQMPALLVQAAPVTVADFRHFVFDQKVSIKTLQGCCKARWQGRQHGGWRLRLPARFSTRLRT